MVDIRKPNAICEQCNIGFHRRPHKMHIKICAGCRKKNFESLNIEFTCKVCGKQFTYKLSDNHNKRRITCSRICSNKNRSGLKYSKNKIDNLQKKRLYDLIVKYKVKNCMVEGCEYDKTYDIHRLIPGKEGGQYEFGNMFAICPNHHAELHRKICDFEKVNDFTLKATYRENPNSTMAAISERINREMC